MSEDLERHIGRRLRSRRRLMGLTQQELAARVGVGSQQIQKYECAACRLSVSRLWDLAAGLNVGIVYFFEGLADAGASA